MKSLVIGVLMHCLEQGLSCGIELERTSSNGSGECGGFSLVVDIPM
jgi:hypothetical protein